MSAESTSKLSNPELVEMLRSTSLDVLTAVEIIEFNYRFSPWFELADWSHRRQSVASFLIGVACAVIKKENLFLGEYDPATGKRFRSFSAYIQFRFPHVKEDEGITLTRQEVSRLTAIGEVYLENRELFEKCGFDPFGHYSKLKFWHEARRQHALSDQQLYDQMISMTKREFEHFAKGIPLEVSTHVHCDYDSKPLRFCRQSDCLTAFTKNLVADLTSQGDV